MSLQPVHVFSGCSKQAMCIKVLPLLFTAATPPAQPEGAAQTETSPTAGTDHVYVYMRACMHVCLRACVRACMHVCVRVCVCVSTQHTCLCGFQHLTVFCV